jgi:hypothetical protein
MLQRERYKVLVGGDLNEQKEINNKVGDLVESNMKNMRRHFNLQHISTYKRRRTQISKRFVNKNCYTVYNKQKCYDLKHN